MSFSDKATLLVYITPSSNDLKEGVSIKYQQLVDSMLFINLINFPDRTEWGERAVHYLLLMIIIFAPELLIFATSFLWIFSVRIDGVQSLILVMLILVPNAVVALAKDCLWSKNYFKKRVGVSDKSRSEPNTGCLLTDYKGKMIYPLHSCLCLIEMTGEDSCHVYYPFIKGSLLILNNPWQQQDIAPAVQQPRPGGGLLNIFSANWTIIPQPRDLSHQYVSNQNFSDLFAQ